ncbi:MAG: Glu-tRNA(Gln) amidotransferase subunit GatE [Acidobacteria bacterium]|nr:Glu-tRNA(Gln) amidotransferase subunit GatE [Acidobacteriota bacterium]
MSTAFDYAAAGLKVGLEVHQQLLTQEKLFCRCPAGMYTSQHDGSVLRHMRPTLSELGEYDGTALMEFKTKKNIIYLLHESNVCTYEMDDTPPFLLNPRALDIAIEQCLMLGCDIVDEVHIARKQYLDGSIPTGFQRTAVVGVAGRIPFQGRELTITQVTLEEDSCREVSDRGHLIVWRTDRLGMPLIETVTAPDLRTPEEVEEAILLIGRVCRSTGHVRVGIGASRQDVNVSVTGGRRVEIKGVSKAGWARKLVHTEAIRQVRLLELRDELHRRGLTRPADIGIEHFDVTDLFVASELSQLRRESWQRLIDEEGRRPGFELGRGPFSVRAVRLPGLAGTISHPTQPGLTFAHELAGRIRVIATLDQQPTLFHSEKWPDYAESRVEFDRLLRRTACGPDDAIVVVWGAEEDTVTAAEEVRIRYADATDGVPHETRQPLPDGRTDFERILPGPDRMYPDTDSPPQRLMPERIEQLRAPLPPAPWVREGRYAAAGIPRSTIRYLIRRGGARLVDLVVNEGGADLRRACFLFGEELKALRRRGLGIDRIADAQWLRFFEILESSPVIWEARSRLVEVMAGSPATDPGELASSLDLGNAPEGWRERVVSLARTSVLDHSNGRPGQRLRFLMGLAMYELRGKVSAHAVENLLLEELGGAQ